MEWLILAIGLIILLGFLLIFTKVKIFIHYQADVNKSDTTVRFSAWYGLLRYTVHIPVLEWDSADLVIKQEKGQRKKDKVIRIRPQDVKEILEDLKTLTDHTIQFHRILKKFMRTVRVQKFRWHSLIGTGNAAHTGTALGIFLTLKSFLVSLLSTYLSFQIAPQFSVQPDFQRRQLMTSFSCILQFRLGQAILTGIKWFRYWKGSKEMLKSRLFAGMNDSNNQSM
ncbi:DUF2953 domain-containing protein [Bacillus massiliglaciei]|uniref:DUF2953 domain-containing protein n=1 Tax=Bacillus massiliglaciei TaxID=1816693 RepID=UPI000B338AF6|nr:DUF2953 domain-containing protein [Bacillus massiliglaciei]